MKLCWLHVHLCLCIVLLLPAPSLAGSINVLTLHDGKLTISASQILLVDLAQELANISGINFTVVGETNRFIDVDIADEPLAKAIAKLAPSHLLVSERVNETLVISEVIFMLQDDNNAGVNFQEFLPTGEPAEGFIESLDPNMQETVISQEVTETSIEQQDISDISTESEATQ